MNNPDSFEVAPVEVARIRVTYGSLKKNGMEGALNVSQLSTVFREMDLVELVLMLTEAGYEIWAYPVNDDLMDEPENDMEMAKEIVQRGDEWCVTSADGATEFGCYPTLAEAEERLRQIEIFAAVGKVLPDSYRPADDAPARSCGNCEYLVSTDDGAYCQRWEETVAVDFYCDAWEPAELEEARKETWTPPQGVRTEANRALEWIAEGEAGDGFTSVGRRRAAQLAAGEPVSEETLVRMRAYFARHAVDKEGEGFRPGQDGYPSPGRVAWAAWGGDPGERWANSVLDRLSLAKNGDEDLTARQRWLYEKLEWAAEVFGPWPAEGADGAHYMSASANPFVNEGMACQNCVFYEGPRACEIVEGDIDPNGLCKFWVIPQSYLTGPAPMMLTKAEDLEEGEFVSWDSSGGRARGQIEHVMREGRLGIPGSDFEIVATPDDPAVLIRIWSEGSDGWEPTETLVGHKSSTVERIDPLRRAVLPWVTKAVDERRFTLGPWYIPGQLDAHGEWTDSNELQQALWGWMRSGQLDIKLQHDPSITAGQVVEAVTWPMAVNVPLVLPNGEPGDGSFPPGTVFLGVVWEPWAWEMVRQGKIRGYSMGGMAQRILVDLES